MNAVASVTVVERTSDLRERIVEAAAQLLASGGREAVSTRAVSAAAGVQAPAIYRQFGDMRDLLHAAAREVLAAYVRAKAKRGAVADPVEELRRGWDVHVAFGLANPAAYALLYADGEASDLPEAREGLAHLTMLVTRVAEAGRLRVSVPLAVKMIHAGGCGATFALIGTPAAARDPQLSNAMRESVLSAILSGESTRDVKGGVAPRAVALRAVLNEADGVLSPGEMQLMGEWLDRISDPAEDRARTKAVASKREVPRRR